VSQRWELAYVIYYFRRNAGIEKCEKAISQLLKQSSRRDLSYVWMAVDPASHFRLLEREMHPEKELHSYQQEILRYVIAKYPTDPFIDHAYYFLQDYAEVISGYPNSLILDRAYYADASTRYYKHIVLSKSDVPDAVLSDIIDRYWLFVEKYPVHSLSGIATEELFSSICKITDERSRLNRLRQGFTKLNNLQLAVIPPEFIRHVIRGAVLKTCNSVPLLKTDVQKTKVVQLLAEFVDLPNFESARLLIADIAFEMNDFELAFTLFSKYSSSFDWTENREARMIAAQRINKCPDLPGSKGYALEVCLALKNTAKEPELALVHLDNYLSQHALPDEVPRVLMLKAYCLSRLLKNSVF
jgi:hypothetical protein